MTAAGFPDKGRENGADPYFFLDLRYISLMFFSLSLSPYTNKAVYTYSTITVQLLPMGQA